MAEETEASTEMPVLDMALDEEKLDQTMPFGEQDFGEMERGKDKLEEELKDKKVKEYFLHLVSHRKPCISTST